MNVFFIERYKDWFPVNDENSVSGIAEARGSGDGCIVYGAYHSFLGNSDVITTGIGDFSKTLGHEFGHLFGLGHDVQSHGVSESEDWCGAHVTNNFMRHSCDQRAFTASQIFAMHNSMDNKDYLNNETHGFSGFLGSNDVSIQTNVIQGPNSHFTVFSPSVDMSDKDFYWRIWENDCQGSTAQCRSYFNNETVVFPNNVESIDVTLLYRGDDNIGYFVSLNDFDLSPENNL
ncbi:MAG: hypothetical protein MRY83_24065, partial [Flavobacteriales bacterium]|nr:hypothetical protein [Flavobacteriales bacterium]